MSKIFVEVPPASLLFFLIQKASDDDDDDFFHGHGENEIEECFNSILNGKKYQLQLPFRHLVEQTIRNFQWLETGGLGNAFNTIVRQYKTNVKNNIKMWSYSRIHTFLKLQRYELNLFGHNISDIDAKMPLNLLCSTTSRQVQMIGIPVGQRLFKTIPIFINIQRQIFEHHERYELLNDLWHRYHRDRVNNAMPRIVRPLKIRNFRVIPIHDYKMKHIRIDCHLLLIWNAHWELCDWPKEK